MISHRGNLHGPNLNKENEPSYIQSALNMKFDVEVDVWKLPNGEFWLGHDEPQYQISTDFLRNTAIWCHAKNSEALNFFREHSNHYHYFWHQNDDYTITSRGYIWVHSQKHLLPKSVCVLPELGVMGEIRSCSGVCSDFIEKYKYTIYESANQPD